MTTPNAMKCPPRLIDTLPHGQARTAASWRDVAAIRRSFIGGYHGGHLDGPVPVPRTP